MIRVVCTDGHTHPRRTLARYEFYPEIGVWSAMEQGDIQTIDRASGQPILGMPAPADLPPTRSRLHLTCPLCGRNYTLTEDERMKCALDLVSEQEKPLDLSLAL